MWRGVLGPTTGRPRPFRRWHRARTRVAARARGLVGSGHFELLEMPMEVAELPAGRADLVLAMGSLQYSAGPEQMLQRLGRWTRPGGWVVVVDSLIALVLELLAAGKEDKALLRLETRRGTWVHGDLQADYDLFDRDRLQLAFEDAGLVDIGVRGLLVGWSALGRERMLRRLAASALLADAGKHLYAWGRVPSSGRVVDGDPVNLDVLGARRPGRTS
jgi:SAM-dependent methyltransferase